MKDRTIEQKILDALDIHPGLDAEDLASICETSLFEMIQITDELLRDGKLEFN